MQYIRADLRDVDKIDIQRLSRPLASPPSKRTLNNFEKEALVSAIDLLKNFNPQSGILRYPVEISEHPPRIDIISPSRVPVGLTAGSKSAATLALGVNTAAFYGLGISVGAGLYGSTTRELGVYTGGSVGVWTNIGYSAGLQYTFIFGPPSDFGGVAIGVGCDVSGVLVGGGAMLLFSLPPFRCLGYSVGVGVGYSTLPFDVTVQVGITTPKPLLYFK